MPPNPTHHEVSIARVKMGRCCKKGHKHWWEEILERRSRSKNLLLLLAVQSRACGNAGIRKQNTRCNAEYSNFLFGSRSTCAVLAAENVTSPAVCRSNESATGVMVVRNLGAFPPPSK